MVAACRCRKTQTDTQVSTRLCEYYSQKLTLELSPYIAYWLTYSRFSSLQTKCSLGALAQRRIYADLPLAQLTHLWHALEDSTTGDSSLHNPHPQTKTTKHSKTYPGWLSTPTFDEEVSLSPGSSLTHLGPERCGRRWPVADEDDQKPLQFRKATTSLPIRTPLKMMPPP